MQARRASRELALILFSQLNEKITDYSKDDFEDIILKSVRILTNNAGEDLKLTLGALFNIKEFIEEYEAEHETNLQRPLGVSNIPVPVPMTSDMIGRIDEMVEIAEKALLALEIAEIATLESQSEVKNYAVLIAEKFKENSEFVDEQIQKFAKGWDIQRLVKMDKDILRISIVELLYIKDAPMKVVVDEALELAKKYSTDESSSFINGILAKVIVENGVS
ncbi:MAG: transcription antitermination factor NusB [Candidatus Gastranaerophilales bacterium]|nr:transcription antitermination factor NusB [Candidatus Gastranaerophilales bacterium]